MDSRLDVNTPEIDAVRTWLRENLDSSHWKEVKWWEPIEWRDRRVCRLKYRSQTPAGGEKLFDQLFSLDNGGCQLLNEPDWLVEQYLERFESGLGSTTEKEKTEQLLKEPLKQIGRAFHNYHDTHGTFPPSNGPHNQLSWRVHLLPFLEQTALYREFRLNEPWDSPHNIQLVKHMPEIYRRSESNTDIGKTTYVGIAGPDGLMENGGGKRLSDLIDGMANTIMVVALEDHAAVIWTKPDDYHYDRKNPTRNLAMWNGGFHALFCDGAVQFIPQQINPQILLNLYQTSEGGDSDWGNSEK